MNNFDVLLDKILSSVSIIVDDVLIYDSSETILLKIRKNDFDDVDEIQVRDYIIYNLTRKCTV